MEILERELAHYGMPRRSGRYPWGSGEDPYQHGRDFLGRIEELKKQGMSDTEIAKSMGLTTTQYRTEKALATNERRALDVARAKSLKEDGLGATEIGRQMGIPESTVRSLLNEKSENRMKEAQNTANFIKSQIDSKGLIDVGKGVEQELNISKEKLNQALYLLEREGYVVYNGRFEQPTNRGKWTTQKIICPPGTEYKEIYNLDKIHPLNEDNYVSRDGGETFSKFQYPKSLDSKRLQIRYNEEGGLEKDGTIEIRRGVKDLSLGNDRYSQVRILVDDTHYLKGMAVYSDDMPDGVDVVFNTNKTKGTPMEKVLKGIKSDPDNPFGALIKAGGQSTYFDDDGNEQLSLINKTRGEGDWNDWSNGLPSQFLSKQSLPMAKKQLALAKADKMAEYEEICSLPNPTIKKHMLQKFADECDSAAVNLKAAALPGQHYHVIIPINSLKDTEVYAPRYENGTKLALIRYPHGGTFEIPILTVNNKNKTAKQLLGPDAIDAVGVTSKVAERLSGADFDGDTVMCIPTHDRQGKVKITSTRELDGLKGFDPKEKYKLEIRVDEDGVKHGYNKDGKEVKLMKNTGTQMGVISNLITDMTLVGATEDELARAVRHSMVVIDAEKHGLDYKQSELDNNIAALHKKYQGKATGGAATIISKAKGEKSVLKRQGTPKINEKGKEWYDPSKPEGAYIFKTADDLEYTVPKTNKRTGEVTMVTKQRHQQSTKMYEETDAYNLVSEAKHPMELAYADYANSMKALANKARMEMVHTGKIEYSSTAKQTYQAEYDSLMRKLNTALLNTTRERAATRKANAEVEAKKRAYKEETGEKMKPADVKKASQVAVNKYRNEVGSIRRKDRSIDITDREWEAIQAGAISETKLKKILDNTDIDTLRERITPRSSTTLSPAKINKAKSMSASNYSLKEIADALGVSVSTISNYLKGAA